MELAAGVNIREFNDIVEKQDEIRRVLARYNIQADLIIRYRTELKVGYRLLFLFVFHCEVQIIYCYGWICR